MIEAAIAGTIVGYTYKKGSDDQYFGIISYLQHGTMDSEEFSQCELAKILVYDSSINKYLQGLNFSDRYYDAVIKVRVLQNPKKSEVIWIAKEIPVIKACRYFYELEDLYKMWVKFSNRMKLMDGAGI